MPCQPTALALYRTRWDLPSFRIIGEVTRLLQRQQILRQRHQPEQQRQMVDVLRHLYRLNGLPVLTPANALFSVVRTDNPRLLESRLKMATAQFPDFKGFTDRTVLCVAGLLSTWRGHAQLGCMYEMAVEKRLLVRDAPSVMAYADGGRPPRAAAHHLDVGRLAVLLREELSDEEMATSRRIVRADFPPSRRGLPSPCSSVEGDSEDEAGVLDGDALQRYLVMGAAMTWSALLVALYGYLRCAYRSTVPPPIRRMLDGVMRTSYEADGAVDKADGYIWCIRNASPAVRENVHKQASSLAYINDTYDLFACNTAAEGDSRNYLLNAMLLDGRDLRDSSWRGCRDEAEGRRGARDTRSGMIA